jgi:hypothetical protein
MPVRPPRRQTAILIAAAVLGLSSLVLITCQGSKGLRRKRGPEYAGETASWLKAVRSLGGDGMWLVVRGYHPGDDAIAIASNSPLSHAVVLDLGRAEVIEAIAPGVVVTPLEDFLRESHRLQIIRPEGWTAERGAAALARAKSAVGKKYDLFGIVGVPSSERYYCSELALWSMGLGVDRRGPQHVVHPRNMTRYGLLLFDSRERDARPDF